MKQLFVINSRKLDGRIHRSWNAELVEESPEFWVFRGVFEKEILHPNLGVIRLGTISYEYYWKHKWFNIFRFHEPEGDLRNFYCNINQPPRLSEGVLDYVDFDIDVLLWKDFSFEILDLDEFERNKNLFRYSDETVSKCLESLDEILSMIKKRQFPFT